MDETEAEQEQFCWKRRVAPRVEKESGVEYVERVTQLTRDTDRGQNLLGRKVPVVEIFFKKKSTASFFP